MVVLILLGTIITAIFNKPQNFKTSLNPELARAMEYQKVEKGQEAVTVDPEQYPDYANGIYPYVQFDAFFLRDLDSDGDADGVRGTCNEVGKEDTLYIELRQLTNGYIKDGATITINGQAGKERNFYLETAIVKDSEIKENSIGNNVNTITLNQIGNGGNGVQKLLTGIVKSGDYTYNSRKTEAIGNNIENYSKENTITFKGIHVRDDGDGRTTEIPIEKTVKFTVDWYGDVKTEIPERINYLDNIRQNGDIEHAIDEENNEINLEFTVGVEEVNNKLILSKSYIEGELPQLSGYDPKKVEITGINVKYTYDKDTRRFTAERQVVLDDEKNLTEQVKNVTTVAYDGTDSSDTNKRYNKYTIKVTYDIEAYKALGEDEEGHNATIEYRVPIKAYYEGYNNKNNQFGSPKKSNTAQNTFVITFRKIEGELARFDVYVGEYISKPTYRYVVSKQKPLKIYNEVSEGEQEDYYTVEWYAVMGTAENKKVIMKESKDNALEYTSDQFLKTDNNKESMEEVSSFVGIYFSDPINMLGEEGEIKVYDDETNILLATFNKDNWSKYMQNTPYKYELPVKHIRIETSNVNKDSYLNVYHIKEINDEAIINQYSKEDFEQLKQIQSTLVGYLKDTDPETENELINTDTNYAYYEAPVSVANVRINKTAISTQETEENFEIQIETEANEQYNEVKWTNGAFLLKLPEDIVDVEIDKVSINNNQVALVSYEEYEEEILNGKGQNEICRFIKVNTENEKEASYTITINCKLTPDPRIPTKTENIELYAYNENNPNYYYSDKDTYDVNDNLNETEQVNKREVALSLVSPNSLLTSQVASNYDTKGSTAVAPQKAIVSRDQQKATVTIEINNNYLNAVSQVKILGKIPKKENTYVINGTNMGSVFDAELTKPITLPEELQEGTKIYYSYEDKVTKEINDGASNWMSEDTEGIDYTKVKSFLIDLQERQLAHEEKHEISYEIKLPGGLKYNEVSYSHHAIYFSLETEHGRYKTQTEPNKLGFMVAKRYDLELTKYQLGTEQVVPGATYSVQEIEDVESNEQTQSVIEQKEAKTRVTLVDGKFTLKDLYLDRTYIVKEIKSPGQYELNKDEIKFKVTETEEGLQVENLNNIEVGNTTGNQKATVKKLEMQKVENADDKSNKDKLVLEVQDEVKANLTITKVEKLETTIAGPEFQGSQSQVIENEIPVVGARFKLTGGDLPETGKVINSDNKGKLNIKGLKIGEEYTLEEVKAEGYYLASPVKFKIVHEAGQDYKIQMIEREETVGAEESSIRKDTVTLTKDENNIPIASFTMEDEKIPRYTLEIIKREKVTETIVEESAKEIQKQLEEQAGAQEVAEPSEQGITYIQGVKFRLYKGTKQIGEYETDGSGKITIGDLYAYEEERKIDQTYTLKEIFAPEGYSKVKDITFKVEKTEDGLQFQETLEEGKTAKEFEVVDNVIKLTVEDNPSFRLIKEDAETKTPIANVKFAIYNVDNGEEPATNSGGEIIGDRETINGKEYYTVKTNLQGEITADLTEGLYKAVELDAPEKYDIENKVYYFGIGASREGIKDVKIDWGKGAGGTDYDYINSVAETNDGGIIAGGYFKSISINLGEGVNGEDIEVKNNGSNDGLIIKYNEEGKVDWAKGAGGTGDDQIESVASTSDGGYIAGGYFSSSINLGEGVNGEDVEVKNNGSNDGLIIKYNELGQVEWAKVVGGNSQDYIQSIATTSDGGYIAGGYFKSSTINLGERVNEGDVEVKNNGSNDALIIKYNELGQVDWAKVIGGTDDDEILSIATTRDGGCIAGGYFKSSTINLGKGVNGEEVVVNNGNKDGLIIKYNEEGKVEWTKVVGGEDGDEILSVASTNDGGYIAGGYFVSKSINLGEGVNGRDVEVKNNKLNDGLIIKYNEKGKVDWAKVVGGDTFDYIKSVATTSDGGYIAGGYFVSESINLGEGANEEVVVGSNGHYDGLIIKYNEEGKVDWAKVVGGTSDDEIRSVASTSDGGIIAGGDFQSEIIKLEGVNGRDVEIKNNGSANMLIIKYSSIEKPQIVTKQAKVLGGNYQDYIQSVATTSDGGYIAGGYFNTNSINLGEGVNGEDIIVNAKGNNDGLIIKYNEEGKVEWAKVVGGKSPDKIQSVVSTSDGGIIAGGYFYSDSINLGEGVNGGNVEVKNNGNYDGIIIKYNKEGKVEWAKVVGGTDADYIESVASTSDGEIIAGGYFYSDSINLGEGVNGEDIIVNAKGNNDGLIIKYNEEGKVDWAKVVGGTSYDEISSVASTADGGYIAGVRFNSSIITLEGLNGKEVEVKNNGNSDGLIIKYNGEGKVEWAKVVGEKYTDEITSVATTSDGGYVAGGNFNSSSITLEGVNGEEVQVKRNGISNGLIIKYNEEGQVEWAKGVGGTSDDEINSVAEAIDGGIIAGGCLKSDSINVGEGVVVKNNGSDDGLIIKYNPKGLVEWAKVVGGTDDDEILSVASTSDGSVIAGGYFESDVIKLDNDHTLTNNGSYDGMIIKINEEMGVPEVQELKVENELKEFKITTDVEEIAGVKGGKISGEGLNPYEKVKYDGESTKPITITPEEGYELVKVTENGIIQEISKLTQSEDKKTYTYPQFTGMKEDRHIVVTFAKTDEKVIINKTDKNGKPLAGAKFRIEQIEERQPPEGVIGDIANNNGQIYYYADKQEGKEIYGLLGKIEKNGNQTGITITEQKVEQEGILGEKIDDTGDDKYWFVETINDDGTKYYEPTNGKKYQEAHDGSGNKINTTAHSYFEIDLRNFDRDVVVKINAEASSESYDYGYATITRTEEMPQLQYSNSVSNGQFMRISGTASGTYTSQVLLAGNKYYLHLGYEKDSIQDSNDDRIKVNSIELYEATCETYYFEESGEGYVSNNKEKTNTVANSYIPIDLRDRGQDEHIAVVLNAQISSYIFNYGYATITNTTTAPSYSSSTGRFIYISENQDAKDYEMTLQGGNLYYLHLGYRNYSSSGSYDNIFKINYIKTYETKEVQFNFEEKDETIEQGGAQARELVSNKYVSTNKGQANTEANSYIPINLEGKTGKYNITVNAEISSQSGGDYGYATITENNIDRVTYSDNTDDKKRFIYISGTQTATNYTIEVGGGKEYRLHLGYYKNATTDLGNDEFIVNSVEVTLSDSELLFVDEIETDANGQIFLNLSQGKYNITETEAPEGYEIANPTVVYDTRTAKKREITIQNNKRPKLIVHHYVKGTDEPEQEPTRVAEDEEYIGSSQVEDGKYQEYETKPKMNLSEYELDYVLQEDGQKEYKMPEKWKGTYDPENVDENGEIVVTYYYVARKVPLTVHHYIQGTTTRVPLAKGGEAQDEKAEGDLNEQYPTHMLSEEQIDEKYEQVEGQEDITATFAYPEVEVIYYYKPVERELIINKYAEDVKTPLAEAKFEIKEKGSLEEGEIYTTDEKGKITVKLPVGEYEITEVEAPDGYQVKKEAIPNVTITRETQEVTQVNVTNEQYVAEVIVNHYIYNKKLENPYTTQKVTLSSGEQASEQIITGHIGDIYGTRAIENLAEGYELYEEPDNSGGIMSKEPEHVNYYYISEAVIKEDSITKDGTQIITSKDEAVHYEIKYTAKVSYYEGNATVTITDTLPYNLDQEAMKKIEGVDDSQVDWLEKLLNGGTYDDNAKTITWTETYNNINTAEEDNLEKEIAIEKDITVIYSGISTAQTSTEITNKVKGKIELDATDKTKETEEVTHTTTTKFVKDVKVTKKWEHGANIYERPSKVKVVLKKGTEQVGQQVLDAANNWTYTFEGLPKYDESTGEEIEYIVEEQEVEGESLDYYKRAV